ncbi:hypothetical protein CcCBS67573_g01515 [Chytriomyces confervae]|uniref:PH domain-containing protein n=1 Tax=Chytriomyces confervae TaxID=246404 RepID=A0A507FLC1_9FUNG|nr:hypothetical protein CcCBS67573_g01515 [Chytriomyces confervae]
MKPYEATSAMSVSLLVNMLGSTTAQSLHAIAAHIQSVSTSSLPINAPHQRTKKRRRANKKSEATGLSAWRGSNSDGEEEDAYSGSGEDESLYPEIVPEGSDDAEDPDIADDAPDSPASNDHTSNKITSTLVLEGDAIWEWQALQSHNAYLYVVNQSGESELTAESLEGQIQAVWEPNRNRYGEYAWWTWDQNESSYSVEGDVDSTSRPAKFMRVEEGASTEEATLAPEPVDEELETEDLHGVHFDPNFGMEVERDLVYDESELTPEEIEIQRWSVAWKQKRALEKAQEQEMERMRSEEQEMLAKKAEEFTRERQSVSYKKRTYPGLYGSLDAANRIIALEQEVQRRFDASGGVGIVPPVIPIGETEQLKWYKELYLRRKHTVDAYTNDDEMEEGEVELEEGEEVESPGGDSSLAWDGIRGFMLGGTSEKGTPRQLNAIAAKQQALRDQLAELQRIEEALRKNVEGEEDDSEDAGQLRNVIKSIDANEGNDDFPARSDSLGAVSSNGSTSSANSHNSASFTSAHAGSPSIHSDTTPAYQPPHALSVEKDRERKLSQNDIHVLTSVIPHSERVRRLSEPVIVAASADAKVPAITTGSGTQKLPSSPLAPRSPRSPLSPIVKPNQSRHNAQRVSTVWDEDDIEALQVARTLAAHASALFPNQNGSPGTPASETVNAVTAQATRAAGVKSRIAAFENLSGGVPDGARAVAPSVPLSRSNIGSLRKANVATASNASLDVSVASVSSSGSLKGDQELSKLNVRQSSLLKKALTKIQSLGADLTHEDDFKALAATIVNSSTTFVNSGATLAAAASTKLTEYLSSDAANAPQQEKETSSADDDADEDLLNSYFATVSARNSVILPSSILSGSNSTLVESASSSSAGAATAKTVSIASPPVSFPIDLIQRSSAYRSTSFANDRDIHDAPDDDGEQMDENGEPVYRSPSKSARDRRQTMKVVDNLAKRASFMPTNRLLRELDTVMADIQQFDLLDNDVGVVVDGDGDADHIVEESLYEENGFDRKEAAMQDRDDSESSAPTQTLDDAEFSAEDSAPRHPAHLVKHLDRLSLYTDVEYDNRSTEDISGELSEGIDLLLKPTSSEGRRTIGLGASLAPLPTQKIELTRPESSEPTSSSSMQTSSFKDELQLFPVSTPTFTNTLSRSKTPTLFPSTAPGVQRRATSPVKKYNRPLSPITLSRGLSSEQRHATLTRPVSPGFMPQSTSPFLRSTSPSLMNPPHSRSISSPTPHYQTMSTLSAPANLTPRNIGRANTPLLNSEDDPDAISGQVKLHTNRLFRAWQETILVLSPRKRGLYYVKTGGNLASTEQVVGFIELNDRTIAESVGKERGVANVFKGRPTFRVCQVLEAGSGVSKKYFYFMADTDADRDMWVNALQEFLDSLHTPKYQQESIYTSNQSIYGGNQSIRSGASASQLSPEDLQLHLLKQQKLLAQQRALMAAVAAQVQAQEEITSELKTAHQYSLARNTTSMSMYSVGGGEPSNAYLGGVGPPSRRPSDLVANSPAMVRGGGGSSNGGGSSSNSIRFRGGGGVGMMRAESAGGILDRRVSGSAGSGGSDHTPQQPRGGGASSAGYERFGGIDSRLRLVDERGMSPVPQAPVTLSRTLRGGRDGTASPGLFSSWFGRNRSKDTRLE